MAGIKLKSIEANSIDKQNLEQSYLYKDQFLDIIPAQYFNKQLNRQQNLKDIQGLYDIQAVKNSIVNCFLTTPGQKILNPEFGIDLRRFLFTPVSTNTTYFIQRDIQINLPKMEPRVQVVDVSVTADVDEQQYNIVLQINCPQLNVYGLSLKSFLNSSGYTIV